MRVIVTDTSADGDERVITTNGGAERALEAWGYDPEKVDYTVEKSSDERLKDLEKAVGRDGEGQRGVAQRIDELEDRIEALEDGG